MNLKTENIICDAVINASIERECPSCGRQGVVIGTSKSEDVFRCTGCDLCFLKKSVRLNSDNDNNWYQNLRDCPQSLVDTFMKDMGDAYSRQLLAIETLTTGRSLLDVGCGVGVFLAIAKRRSWNAQGVDASEHAAYFASKHFGIKYSSSLVDFENSTFDVVRISHVLEHIPEPKPFLIRLQQLIKPGGILAVIVPNREPFCATIVNKIRRITSSKPRLAGAIYPDMHVLGFSPNSLTRLVIQAGFEPVTVFTVSMGNKVYFPMFYDGLLVCNKLKDLTLRSLVKYHLPMFIDNIGNLFGKGQWIVAHFRKKQS